MECTLALLEVKRETSREVQEHRGAGGSVLPPSLRLTCVLAENNPYPDLSARLGTSVLRSSLLPPLTDKAAGARSGSETFGGSRMGPGQCGPEPALNPVKSLPGPQRDDASGVLSLSSPLTQSIEILLV